MINHYMLNARYLKGGRGPVFFDCWGLVREVRHRVCGMALLPEWGAVGFDCPRANTLAYHQKVGEMRLCERPEPGSIAVAFRGRVCEHVGVVLEVDGRLCVMDINPGGRPRRISVARFEASFQEVRYYND